MAANTPSNVRQATVRRGAALLTAVALAIALGGCGDDDTVGTGGTGTTAGPTTTEPGGGGGGADDLVGRTFVVQGVTEGGKPKALVDGAEVRVTFSDDGSLGASGGCNSMGGKVTFEDGRLHVDAMAMTEMACDEDRMAQDQWLAAVLGDEPAFVLDGDDLTLTTRGGTVLELVDREVAHPDLPLELTNWVVDSIIEGDAASNVATDRPARLTFRDDGTVEVFDGCNSGSGPYAAEGGELTFGAVAMTKMACVGEAANAHSGAIASLLKAESITFAIEEDLLSLRLPDGSGVDLRAQGDDPAPTTTTAAEG